MKKDKVSIQNIGPAEAKEMLSKIGKQRPLNSMLIKKYSMLMKKGLWQLSQDAIAFDSQEMLINGQHRLNAVVHSMTAQQFIVAYDMPTESFCVMDTGKRRTYEDTLFVEGFNNYKAFASLAGKVLRYENDCYYQSVFNKIPSNEDVVEYCKTHQKEMMFAINYIAQKKRILTAFVSAPLATFLFYMFRQKDPAMAVDFFETLTQHKIEGVKRYNNIKILQQRLKLETQSYRTTHSRIMTKIFIAAWNGYRANTDAFKKPSDFDSYINRVGKIDIA